jgi:hypothetical protein
MCPPDEASHETSIRNRPLLQQTSQKRLGTAIISSNSRVIPSLLCLSYSLDGFWLAEVPESEPGGITD